MNTPPDEQAVWNVLRTIPDPEFGINLVDLGLIYSVVCTGGDIKVVMTLTTPTCPSGGWIHEGVRRAVEGLPGVGKVAVEMVFDPPWTPAMLSKMAQQQLGSRE
ncbi:MAG: metal-sulfur cluster assembly factor [Verrucomicrobia bacterium]|nr:metal-sulfur cluster assembly factor [Verrucomicrobiota bacterium]